jgi:GNAT superfamily N-acetyltransferase
VLKIQPATEDDLDDVLPLFAGYQVFYTDEQQPDEKNRAFLAMFVSGEAGRLLVARDEQTNEALGFANIYWTWSSTQAEIQVLMNDLFVSERARGQDVGHALIEACRDVARERGSKTLCWVTDLDNRKAQRLYERFDAKRSTTFEYDLNA